MGDILRWSCIVIVIMGFNIWELHRIWKTPVSRTLVNKDKLNWSDWENKVKAKSSLWLRQNRFRAISAISRAEFPGFSKLTEGLPLVGLNACCPLLAKVSICELNVQNFNENTPQVLIFFPMVWTKKFGHVPSTHPTTPLSQGEIRSRWNSIMLTTSVDCT